MRAKGSGMPGGKRRQLYLDDETWEELRIIGATARDLGGGNGRSAAIRDLAAQHRASRLGRALRTNAQAPSNEPGA